MPFWDVLLGKKKRAKPISRAIVKKREKVGRTAKEGKGGAEDPIFTVSRQLTNMERDLEQINATLLSGFKGLREDHHKILDEQATKNDFGEFRKYLEEKKTQLEKMREQVDRELEMLDIDKKIVSLVERRKMRAAEVAKELKISRQYAAMRLSELTKYNVVEQARKGREVYYILKK